MLPQRLAGRDLFWWLTRLGLLRVTVNSRLGGRMSRRDFVIGTNRRRLESTGVRFRPRLVDAEDRAVRFADHGLLEDVGVVVWATGYRSDYGWIHIPGVVREGHVGHGRRQPAAIHLTGTRSRRRRRSVHPEHRPGVPSAASGSWPSITVNWIPVSSRIRRAAPGRRAESSAS
jgi:hypothetical protein